MDNGQDMAAALLGVWLAGGIATIVNATAPPSHITHVLDVARPRACLVSERKHDELEAAGLPVGDPESITRVTHAVPDAWHVTPGDPASILFTSGSTGKPKGVTQSHGNLMRGCAAVAQYTGLTGVDRILCPIPWSFDYGYGQLLSTIMLGATQILPTIANPFGLCEAIAQHRPTAMAGLPSWFTYLFHGVTPFKDTDSACLRIIMNTGGTIPRPVLDEMLAAFENARIFLNYGLTETYRTSFLPPELARTKPTSIGKGIPGVEVVVVREDGTRCPPGETGEIIHRGDYTCLGYWNDPEATARTLRPDPFAPAGCPTVPKVVYTGDFGYTDDDGDLYFAGRRDQQLKSMGVRVSPGEIEALLHASGLVREAGVFGRAHDLIGDEIWAAVSPAAPNDKLVRDLRKYARGTMSQYMQPQRYLVMDVLPKTHTGKIDYPALKREADAQGASASLTGGG
jgi:acyl-CoA synthetase (AMP-forming)/AMP-acid ligase II